MRFHSTFVALFVVALLSGAGPAEGRVVRDWSYTDLMTESDLVAIVEPIKNENNSDQWEWVPKFAQGVTTTFKVLCVLKGDVSNGAGVRLKHFVYSVAEPANGGAMVNFLVGPLNIDATFTQDGKPEPWRFENVHPQWLVFLKKTPGGDFVPTSGQIDPSFSFRELHQAAMYDPSHGMIRK